MNELIYKLTKQADTLARVIEPDLREIVRYNRIRDEKFAELIVQECVEQVITGVKCNPPQPQPPELVQTLVRRIQRHFEVEE